MRLVALLLGLSFASCTVVPSSNYESSAANSKDRANRVTAYLGGRSFSDDNIEDAGVEDQGVIGVQFSQQRADWAVGWEAGLLISADSDDGQGFDVDVATAELYGGVRKSFGSGVVRPYVGAGLSLIGVAVDVEVLDDDDDDSALGFYAHGGVDFQITPLFSLGLDVRGLLGADVELFGADIDTDYLQFALAAGFSF